MKTNPCKIFIIILSILFYIPGILSSDTKYWTAIKPKAFIGLEANPTKSGAVSVDRINGFVYFTTWNHDGHLQRSIQIRETWNPFLNELHILYTQK